MVPVSGSTTTSLTLPRFSSAGERTSVPISASVLMRSILGTREPGIGLFRLEGEIGSEQSMVTQPRRLIWVDVRDEMVVVGVVVLDAQRQREAVEPVGREHRQVVDPVRFVVKPGLVLAFVAEQPRDRSDPSGRAPRQRKAVPEQVIARPADPIDQFRQSVNQSPRDAVSRWTISAQAIQACRVCTLCP